MTDFDSKIAALKEKREPLYDERDALTDKIVKLSKQIEKLREQKEQEQMKQPMTPVQEMEYFLFEDGSVSGERYKAREKYWRDKGLWNSGYHPDIQQVNLQMMLYKGEQDNLEQTISTIEEVLPLLKAHNGVKRLDIFEHTCSKNGSWSVDISRHDPILVQVVEQLGDKANGMCAKLRIYETDSDKYIIEEYDGNETVVVSYDNSWVMIK